MPTGILSTTIVFPAMTAQQEAQLKSLLGKIGEFMGDKIETESKIVVAVNIPSDRNDIAAVISRIRSGMERPKKKVEAAEETGESA